MSRRILDVLAGLLLIAIAFWAGAQKSPVWGLFGFLPFFTIGVLIIIQAFQRKEEDDDRSRPDQT